MKPIIGLTPFVNRDNRNISIKNSYINAVIKSGGIPIILPLTNYNSIFDMIVEYINGIIFTGGHDINCCYCSKECKECKDYNSIKDNMDILDENEFYLLRKCVEVDKPVLGICRGCQLINMFDGGTLYEDIPTEFKSDIVHLQSKPDYETSHEVVISSDSRFYNKIKITKLLVNSFHHQGIKVLGSHLKPIAKSYDGLVEGVEMLDSKFIMGVQWHPECLYEYDYASRCIFKMFIDSCLKN